jgi:hypothetical protein
LWAIGVSTAFLLAGIFVPSVLRQLNSVWIQLGLLLGRIVNPIVMTVLFCLVFTPVAMLLRALGKDLLKVKSDPQANSYWVDCKDDSTTGSMVNQF